MRNECSILVISGERTLESSVGKSKGITDAEISSVIGRECWSPHYPVLLLSNIRTKKKCFPLTVWRGCEVERRKREQRQKKEGRGERRRGEGLEKGEDMAKGEYVRLCTWGGVRKT